jgi:hypothetical protein
MFFSEINSALGLLSRATDFIRHHRTIKRSVAGRFVRLFAAHGVNRNQILRVLRLDLTLADVQTDESLLKVLTDDMVDKAARLFAVRREWLEGASNQIYPTHDFYKRSEEFAAFLDRILAKPCVGALRGVLLVAKSYRFEETALLVLEEEIGGVGDKPLYRYHFCNNWIFNYGKSRAHLTACVAIAWARKVYIFGREVPIGDIRRYRDGISFLDCANESSLPMQGRTWYPEDMAIKPANFLEGLKGQFERYHALEVWLTLESIGLMQTGLPYQSVRSTFEKAMRAP